jgi:predicted O-methyltransferase YrrM
MPNHLVRGSIGRQLSSESAFTQPTSFCSRVELWSAPDAMSSECEVTDFIYALVRLLKPEVVLETGCFLGVTSVAIGRALATNGFGRLVTCDLEADFVAGLRTKASSLHLPIECIHAESTEVIAGLTSVDIAFVDSGYDRAAEVTALIPKMSRFGIIALHDTAPHQWQVEDEYFESQGLRCLYMNTPRGLSLFQKHP